MAAGFMLDMPVEEIKEALLAELKDFYPECS